MRTYFRLLSFANPIGRYAFPYILFTLLAIVFGTLNLALLAPLLSTLFKQASVHEMPVKPEHVYDVFKMFNYYDVSHSYHHLLRPIHIAQKILRPVTLLFGEQTMLQLMGMITYFSAGIGRR